MRENKTWGREANQSKQAEGKPAEYILWEVRKTGLQEEGPGPAVSQLLQRNQNGYGLQKVQLVKILCPPPFFGRKQKPRTQINFTHLLSQYILY